MWRNLWRLSQKRPIYTIVIPIWREIEIYDIKKWHVTLSIVCETGYDFVPTLHFTDNGNQNGMPEEKPVYYSHSPGVATYALWVK